MFPGVSNNIHNHVLSEEFNYLDLPFVVKTVPFTTPTTWTLLGLCEDVVWPYDWDNPFDLEVALNKWIDDYINDFPHQSMNNMTPRQFYESYFNKERVLT